MSSHGGPFWDIVDDHWNVTAWVAGDIESCCDKRRVTSKAIQIGQITWFIYHSVVKGVTIITDAARVTSNHARAARIVPGHVEIAVVAAALLGAREHQVTRRKSVVAWVVIRVRQRLAAGATGIRVVAVLADAALRVDGRTHVRAEVAVARVRGAFVTIFWWHKVFCRIVREACTPVAAHVSARLAIPVHAMLVLANVVINGSGPAHFGRFETT